MKYALYLASDSTGRKQLLKQAEIPFHIISHKADEFQCNMHQSLEKIVREIAQMKMQHATLPEGQDGQIIFVVTADTLTIDAKNQICAKPINKDQAKQMIRAFRAGAIVGTAFCLEKKIFQLGVWHSIDQIVDYDQAWGLVDIPEEFLDFYLDKIPFLTVSGGVSIEGFGEQFIQEIRGNYSAILGMPMFKLRKALYRLGFYE